MPTQTPVEIAMRLNALLTPSWLRKDSLNVHPLFETRSVSLVTSPVSQICASLQPHAPLQLRTHIIARHGSVVNRPSEGAAAEVCIGAVVDC